VAMRAEGEALALASVLALAVAVAVPWGYEAVALVLPPPPPPPLPAALPSARLGLDSALCVPALGEGVGALLALAPPLPLAPKRGLPEALKVALERRVKRAEGVSAAGSNEGVESGETEGVAVPAASSGVAVPPPSPPAAEAVAAATVAVRVPVAQ
jgi:hypothetical protein